jgi:hypothetical protein
VFEQSLINFEIKSGENIEKLSISKSYIYGFVEKEKEGMCILTSFGVHVLITPKEDVVKQIDRYNEFVDETIQKDSSEKAKLIVGEMKKLLNESERDRLFGDNL